jgi:hypothetical protein
MRYLEEDPLPTETVSGTQADQRRHPRYLSIDGGTMRLAVRPEFRGRRALLVDVSTSGIGFLTGEAVEAGTVLVFELRGAEGAETFTRIARVRHCCQRSLPENAPWLPTPPAFSKMFRRLFGGNNQPPKGEAWLVGCEFDRPLNETEIKQLLDQFNLVP